MCGSRVGGAVRTTMTRLVNREPERWIAKIVDWRDVACCRSVWGLLGRQTDPTWPRLGRGSHLTKARRWYQRMQKVCGEYTAGLEPLQTVVQTRLTWAEIENKLLSSNTRRPHSDELVYILELPRLRQASVRSLHDTNNAVFGARACQIRLTKAMQRTRHAHAQTHAHCTLCLYPLGRAHGLPLR